jgi:hypothetical protein
LIFVQVLRKDAGLAVSQRIQLGLATESAALRGAIAEHRDYIMDEVLAVRLEDSPLEDAKAKLELTVEGDPVLGDDELVKLRRIEPVVQNEGTGP